MLHRKLVGAIRGFAIVAVIAMSCAVCFADGEPSQAASTQNSGTSNAGLYLKVRLDGPVKLSKLKPGDIVQGKLARDVYSDERELFAAESPVQLKVARMESRRRKANDHWPWVVKAFTPRHEKYPVFESATISGAQRERALQVSVISISRRREVHAQSKGKRQKQSGTIEVSQQGGLYGAKNSTTPVMVLEATAVEGTSSEDTKSAQSPQSELSALEALPAGTAFKILLLGDVSASRSKPGDVIEARLLQPAYSNSRLALPAGSLFTGKVLKPTPPRWGSRAGSLSLAFTAVTLPDGNLIPIAASLASAELDRASHTKIDAEGKLHGERAGKAWMAINLGVTAGLAKEVDDGTQLIVEALISTATDASTAGTARIAASCVSGIFMLTRHGRDVVLPRFTEMDIALDRPLEVTKKIESASTAEGLDGR